MIAYLKSLVEGNIETCAAVFIWAFIADRHIKPQRKPRQRVEHITDTAAVAGKEILQIKTAIGKHSACAHKSSRYNA